MLNSEDNKYIFFKRKQRPKQKYFDNWKKGRREREKVINKSVEK